jgi:hypothetical protein
MGNCIISPEFAISQKLFVASHTIFVNYFPSSFMDENNLRFHPQCKHGGMSQTIFCLEKVFIKYIVMRNMAVVTVCFFPMGAVVPCSILGSHEMAINAGFRIVTQI